MCGKLLDFSQIKIIFSGEINRKMFKSGYAAKLCDPSSTVVQIFSSRTIVPRIPHWEYHIRFDPRFGRKRPAQDVHERFKRLNNGMWIHARSGRYTRWYQKDHVFQKTNVNWETCTKEQCSMLDKMMTPFWLRQKHYVDDPFEPYQTRYDIDSPRVDDRKKLVRERPKILLDDLTADRFFSRLSDSKIKAELLLREQKSDLPKLLQKTMPKKALPQK